MAVLPQLLDVESYRACEWDLKADAAGRAEWLHLFRWHLDEVILPLARVEYPRLSAAQRADLRADYLAAYLDVEQHPERQARLDVLRFTELRRDVLNRHACDDPFRHVKEQENAAAVALLPAVLAELDAAGAEQRRELLLRGLMAGNMFDLGSRATIEQHRDGGTAFHRALAAVPARPWFVDDAAAFWRRWSVEPAWRHAVLFIDNAGGDFVLGCLPLVRSLVRRGTRVTLAANSGPALNDVTAAELPDLLASCAERDSELHAALVAGLLAVAATGSTTPLVDLTNLSERFVASIHDADLIWLHGMGRAIESNWHARLACDAVSTAILKDKAVAGRLGAGLFDCVMRFHPAPGAA